MDLNPVLSPSSLSEYELMEMRQHPDIDLKAFIIKIECKMINSRVNNFNQLSS